MKQNSLSKSFSTFAAKEANVWITVAAVLFVILVAWFWNAKLAGMVSGAAGLNFGRTGVTLVNEKNRPYADFISVSTGQTIQIGFRSQGVRSCTASWRAIPANTKQLAAGPYVVDGNTILEVKCITTKGITVKDSLQVTTGSSTDGDFAVTKPTSNDVWELGGKYEIVWNAKAACGRADLGCDANPQDKPDLGTRGICTNPSSDCSDNVINCVKAPCPEELTPPTATVTISLNQELPSCVTAIGTDRCYVKQTAPYVISEDALNTGTFDWTIPASLNSNFWGKQQITVTVNGTGRVGRSAVFSIVQRGSGEAVMRVVSPNGGEQWTIGSEQQIKWTSAKLSGTATIELREFRDCSQACTARQERQYIIASNVSNSGAYKWSVGSTQSSSDVTPGTYVMLVKDSAGNSDQSDAPFSVVSKSEVKQSGIEGIIKTGPTCGGAIQVGNECADKPYKTTMQVKTANGATLVTSFSSAADGTFKVNLPPGTYLIEKTGTGRLPSFSPQTVTVKDGSYTYVTLNFDTGLR